MIRMDDVIGMIMSSPFDDVITALKALTDHLVGGWRIYLFDPYL